MKKSLVLLISAFLFLFVKCHSADTAQTKSVAQLPNEIVYEILSFVGNVKDEPPTFDEFKSQHKKLNCCLLTNKCFYHLAKKLLVRKEEHATKLLFDCALDNQPVQTFSFLLNAGANANAQDDDGNTPLMCIGKVKKFVAIEQSSSLFSCVQNVSLINKHIEVLLEHGADPRIINNDRVTLFDVLGDEVQYVPSLEEYINSNSPA